MLSRVALRPCALTLVIVGWVFGAAWAASNETRVLFDIPDAVECRDVTPNKCAAEHPTCKVIEAKFRISASFLQGTEASIADFLYVIRSPEMRMRIQDYLPNTILESATADNSIEVAETTESSESTNEDLHVGYKLCGLGLSMTQGSKKTESDKYKKIVPKELVLASGTTDREHGVFFKLRPSNEASLEGAREFTFLAIVPKSWRGDWCTLSCAARAKKKVFLAAPTLVLAGIEQAHVGLYLAGDQEAKSLAERLCEVQEANGGVLSQQLNKEAEHIAESMHAAAVAHHIFGSPTPAFRNVLKFEADTERSEKGGDNSRDKLTEAQKSMAAVQEQLRRLSGWDP